jgi:signal transduction histidine kinase
MTIRTRLALWYAVIFSVSLLVIGITMYSDLVVEQRDKIARHRTAGVDEDAGEDITQIILLYGGTAAAVGLLGGWWLTRRAFAPVAALTEAVEKIHENTLHQTLPRTGNGDELDRLTEVFNSMTVRLDGSFQRIREFTLHASHELKTPLTIIHGELETELGAEYLSPAQRERLASQLDEIQRLTKIVDGLSLLTKADAGQIKLNFETVALAEIVRDVFADAQILGKPTGLSVSLVACEEIKIHGDKHRLRQLLLNLADNAVKYNQPGGVIGFFLKRDGADAELKITNSGKSILSENLPRVFDRFFRGDLAHNNSGVDGCGLGLSIAQWIVSAHNGSIRIASAEDITTVTVRLPVASGEKAE